MTLRPTASTVRMIALCLLASWCAFAGQSLNMAPGKTGSFTIPNQAKYNPVSTFRWEFRVHNWNLPGSGIEYIWNIDSNHVRATSIENQLNIVDGNVSTGFNLDLTGRSDVLIRYQRDAASNLLMVEMWNYDGSGYYVSSVSRQLGPINMSGTFNAGTTNATLNLSWFRWYSTLLPLGSPPPANSTGGGDLADWEFEGTGNDSSPNHINLSGTFTYSSTPAYPPVASPRTANTPLWTNRSTVRAGHPVLLDGSGSYSLNDSPALTYLWQRLQGPSMVQFENQTAAQTSVTGLVTGTYVFKLTVTDSTGLKTSGLITIGAVATDSRQVVVPGDADVEFAFGPLIRFGASPWPYLDRIQQKLTDHFGSTLPLDEWNTPLEGTITATNGSTTITGSGTSFLTDFGNGTACSPALSFVVWYPLAGGATGKRRYSVVSCASDTEMTISPAYDSATAADLQYSKWSTEGLWIGGSGNVNYYDNVMAYYSLYYRSGLTVYRDYARTLADRWWTMPSYIDEGRGCYTGQFCSPPRVRALTGLIWRAHEGRADMWPGLHALLDPLAASLQASTNTELADIREDAYVLAFVALAAKVDPDPAKRTTYKNAVLAALNNRWKPQRQPAGNWTVWSYGYQGQNTNPANSVNVTQGSNIITGNNVSGYWATDMKGYWIQLQGETAAYYTLPGSNNTQLVLDRPYAGATATNRNYQMNVFVGYGTQPFMMGIVGTAFSYIYKLTGNADARTFVVDAANWLQNVGTRMATRGLYYGRIYPPCEPDPDSAPNCTYGSSSNPSVIAGERYLNAEVFNTFAQAYLINGTATLKNHGDLLFGAALGADGGPVTDSYWVNELDETIATNKHKNLGFFFGYGFAASWPAARLGGVLPVQNTPVSINVSADSVPAATQVRLTVTQPSGAQQTTLCPNNGDTCAVQLDRRQGAHLVQIAYLAGDGTVLSTGEPLIVKAQ